MLLYEHGRSAGHGPCKGFRTALEGDVSPGSGAHRVALTFWGSAPASVKCGYDSLPEWLGEASEFMSGKLPQKL